MTAAARDERTPRSPGGAGGGAPPPNAAAARDERTPRSPGGAGGGAPPPNAAAARDQRTRLVLYFDGACRGNPGPASYGVFSPSGIERRGALGRTTNNVAEWKGFLAALDAALEAGASDVEIRADSQLVLRQFTGEYRMKAPHLAPYLAEARQKARKIGRVSVTHVPREQNRDADRLANLALDE